MKKQVLLCCLMCIALFAFAFTPQAIAQEPSKAALSAEQREKKEFKDSITTRMRLVREKYQRQIDSVLSNNQIEGQQKWQLINALTRERNLSIWRLTERVKAKNSFREFKP